MENWQFARAAVCNGVELLTLDEYGEAFAPRSWETKSWLWVAIAEWR